MVGKAVCASHTTSSSLTGVGDWLDVGAGPTILRHVSTIKSLVQNALLIELCLYY